MLAVVYEFAVLSEVPPLATLNHATVPPAGAVAVNVRVPVPHLEAPLALGTAGLGFIVAVIFLLAAERQPPEMLR